MKLIPNLEAQISQCFASCEVTSHCKTQQKHNLSWVKYGFYPLVYTAAVYEYANGVSCELSESGIKICLSDCPHIHDQGVIV